MDKRPVGRQLAKTVIERLEQRYGIPECTLDDRADAWRLLVAAILAAQCTDERVNKVTPALWAAYPTIEAMAGTSAKAIEPYVKSCGLYRNKAKNIQLAAVYLLEAHEGAVPDDLDALLRIPGVGRKIANLLLGEIFGQQAIVVDTHCGRLARRIGLSKAEDPTRVERDLCKFVPEPYWSEWGHLMVEHGRNLCKARKPDCGPCPLNDICLEGRRFIRQQGVKT